MTETKTTRQMREEAIDWLFQLRENPDDAATRASFDAWMTADPRHTPVFEQIECLIGDTSRLLCEDERFLSKASRKPVSRKLKGAAAAFAGLCLLAGLHLDIPLRLRADHISDTGRSEIIRMADGSVVTLNANSAIAIRFTPQERCIILLRGEVFVDVRPDPSRPFCVEAGGGKTTALGTAFDVDLRGAETQVAVEEHSVKIDAGAATTPTILQQNQSIVYDESGRVSDPQTLDPSTIGAWRQGRLAFENQPLGDIVTGIQRYLPGHVLVATGNLRQKRLSGSLDLTHPKAALEDLAAAFEIRVTHIGAYLTILH
jgi:transmembrane sensor